MKEFQKKSADEKRAEIQALTDKIAEGIKSFSSTEAWKTFLRMSSKFHRYSWQNRILIAMQCPKASQVAGYQSWKQLNRYVRAGEKAIKIFCPSPVKLVPKGAEIDNLSPRDRIEFETTGKVTRLFFKPGSVFDLSQTEGEPLPDICEELKGEIADFQSLFDAFKQVNPSASVRFEDIEDGAKGYYQVAEGTIVIKRGMSEVQSLKTLAHELSHSILHSSEEGQKTPRDQKEIEAESVAYIVCNHFGIDTSDYSFEYLTSWTDGNEDNVRTSIEAITKTADNFIDIVESALDIDSNTADFAEVI